MLSLLIGFMDDSAIKTRIKARREALGLSQTEMARRLGISRNAYVNIEKPLGMNGSTKITKDFFPDLARELKISEEELMLGFLPCHPGDSNSLEDAKAGYLEKEKAIKDDYEARLSADRELIAALNDNITSLKRLLEEKEQTIAVLKKRKKS